MFIKKRIRKLRDGKKSFFYQAVQSKRIDGKVVKKVISLGEYPSIEEAIKWELKVLRRIEQSVNYPITEYKEVRHSVRYNKPVVVTLPVKTAEKRRQWWLNKFEEQKERIAKLRKWESRYCR
ncbi:MAG: hypothetical protein WAV31_02870 [Candidatus Moraniibacteriota bacterium]